MYCKVIPILRRVMDIPDVTLIYSDNSIAVLSILRYGTIYFWNLSLRLLRYCYICTYVRLFYEHNYDISCDLNGKCTVLNYANVAD